MHFGFVCALDVEMKALLDKMSGGIKVTRGDLEIYRGTIYGQDVSLIRCGVGKVNAARGTQMMLDVSAPDVIINNGIAGGLAEGLNIGDVVVATDLVQHDYDITQIGYVPGSMIEAKNPSEPTAFKTDVEISESIIKIAEGQIKLGKGINADSSVHRGRIVSGDLFIAGAEVKARLRDTFGAVAGEMESAAIAQTAAYGGTRCAILRTISDLADGAAPQSYDAFEERAAQLAAEIALEFLRSRND